ncbi:MAG: hypothetical protein H0W72_01165 [Planctomycetes bacterium]|nr:hypothetical protein [Planctomycetota bacterium]
MTTIAVAVLLAGMSVASLLPALRRGKVAEAASTIDAANQEARTRARLEPSGDTVTYGVRLVGNVQPNRVEVLRNDASGVEVIQRFDFNRNVQIHQGDNPLAGTMEWYFQPRTGYPLDATQQITAIGAVLPGDPRHLSLRTHDGRNRYGVAIYEIGLVSAEVF